MARFRFRLEPVLEHRQRIEDEKQVILAAKLRAQAYEEQRLLALRGRYEHTVDELREHHGRLAGLELETIYAHLEFLRGEIERQESRLAACVAETNHARADVITASREKKVLAMLKERQRTVFVREELAREQRESDDLNARRYGSRP